LTVNEESKNSDTTPGRAALLCVVSILLTYLLVVLIITLRDSADPSYGSGANIGGIGLVLILGLGLILVGLVFMLIMRARQPEFFRGETIIHESAHAMRPHEHLVS
jgi:hypothetical protein